MENMIPKSILCELCACNFDDQSGYEVHRSFVHEKMDEFDEHIQFHLYNYVHKLVYGNELNQDIHSNSDNESNTQYEELYQGEEKFPCHYCDAR